MAQSIIVAFYYLECVILNSPVFYLYDEQRSLNESYIIRCLKLEINTLRVDKSLPLNKKFINELNKCSHKSCVISLE